MDKLKKYVKINLMRLSLKVKIGTGIIILIVFFAVLNITSQAKSFKNIFYLISSPIQKTFWQAGDNCFGFLESFFHGEKFKKENEKLYSELLQLRAENAFLSELKKENEALRNALSINLEKDFKLSFVKIIGKNIFQDSFLINKGKKDGILKDMPAITDEKVLIGRVGEVYDNFSEVILISNGQSSFDVKIAIKEISSIAKGRGGLKLALEFLPLEVEIEKGELVLTSSLGGIFPENILVGQIKNTTRLDVDPFQSAEVELAADFKRLNSFFIITDF